MGDNFERSVGRTAVLQLASLCGFEAASEGSLEVLADVARSFAREVCSLTRFNAEIAGRTAVNAEDLVR